MLLGNTKYPDTYEYLLSQKVWEQVFDWIEKNGTQDEGDYEIDGENIYASIQLVQTMPREQATFERHFEYIDLHYCVNGGEIIEWLPAKELSEPTESNVEKDYALHTAPEKASSLLTTPNTFAIFFPEDAHM